MSENPPIRLGLIGAGSMGREHAAKVRAGQIPALELVAVADAMPENLKHFEGLATFRDGPELIHSGTVDAVLIATPHYSHTTLGIEALQAGLHVLVEKPISSHKQDCEKLIAAYDPSRGQVFAAMFNQRTDPRYRKLKQLIDENHLGAIQRVQWTVTNWFRSEIYYKSGDWRATWAGEGGGVLLNQCPHNLDLWQWLFGMPASLFAHCQLGRFHQIEVEDSVTALLEYDNGLQGVFVTSTGEAPGVNRLEVAGEHGLVTVEDNGLRFQRNESSSTVFSQTTTEKFGLPPIWNVHIPTQGVGEQHLGILKNFAKAILGEEELIAPASEGIHSVELANAMLLSSFRGAKLTLPIDSSEFAEELKKKIETSQFVKESIKTVSNDDFSKSFA